MGGRLVELALLAGHQGAWQRSARFSDSSSVRVWIWGEATAGPRTQAAPVSDDHDNTNDDDDGGATARPGAGWVYQHRIASSIISIIIMEEEIASEGRGLVVGLYLLRVPPAPQSHLPPPPSRLNRGIGSAFHSPASGGRLNHLKSSHVTSIPQS